MNILIIGKYYTESFASHISSALRLMEHNTYEVEWGVRQKSEGSVLSKRYDQFKGLIYNNIKYLNIVRSIARSHVKKLTNQVKIDLVICCHDFLTYEDASFIKSLLKAPIILWFPDSISNFYRHLFMNARYDYLFFKDPYIVWNLKKDFNVNAFYLPECCNPVYHKLVELSGKDLKKYSCDICTAGNLYASRALLFSNLTEYDIKIWGNPAPLWMNTDNIKHMIQNEYVCNEEKAKAFSAAKIVINNLHPAEIWGINARSFEIPACGGFELISSRKGLDQLFVDGKELVSYNSLQDLKEKITYYLNNEEDRKIIASEGYRKAHSEHTYRKRLDLMIDTVFGNKEGFEMPGFINNEYLPKN